MRNKHSKRKNIFIIPIILILITIGVVFWVMNKNQFNNNDYISETTSVPEKNEGDNIESDNEINSSNIVINNDLFAKYYEQAESLLQSMTLEEKVGQMFLVRFPNSGVIEEIQNYNPGGYILFGQDFKNETRTSILQKLQECQNASKIKLLLGVDEEGGTVVRVSNYLAFRSSKFLSPQQLWASGGLSAILNDSTEKSNLLKSIGIFQVMEIMLIHIQVLQLMKETIMYLKHQIFYLL